MGKPSGVAIVRALLLIMMGLLLGFLIFAGIFGIRNTPFGKTVEYMKGWNDCAELHNAMVKSNKTLTKEQIKDFVRLRKFDINEP